MSIMCHRRWWKTFAFGLAARRIGVDIPDALPEQASLVIR